jgi:hypothetical protein
MKRIALLWLAGMGVGLADDRPQWEDVWVGGVEGLPAEERADLDHYLEIKHLMRLAKARARQLLAHGD